MVIEHGIKVEMVSILINMIYYIIGYIIDKSKFTATINKPEESGTYHTLSYNIYAIVDQVIYLIIFTYPT